MSIESCNHKELRNLIVDKMNNKLFSRKHDIKKYKENMRKLGIKGGDMELTKFAHWEQCIITIYDKDKQTGLYKQYTMEKIMISKFI
jgi:hypothetical protein